MGDVVTNNCGHLNFNNKIHMKILFLSHYSFLYGSNRSLDSLIDYFSEHGYEVEVLLPSKGEFYKHLSRKKVKVSTFMFLYEVLYYKANIKYLSLPLLWLYDFVVFPLLVLKVKHISPDIIYSNSSADLFSVWIAKLLKIKHVIHIREFMEEDFGGRCIIGKKMKRKILLKSDKVVCVSQAVANTVIGNLPYYAKVIYNGLPINIAECEYPDFSKNLRIGVVGNIDVSKQQGLAINYMPEILSVFPHATLHIIGDKECSYEERQVSVTKENCKDQTTEGLQDYDAERNAQDTLFIRGTIVNTVGFDEFELCIKEITRL